MHPRRDRYRSLCARGPGRRHSGTGLAARPRDPEFLAKHPKAKARYDKNRGAIDAKVTTIRNTCAAY